MQLLTSARAALDNVPIQVRIVTLGMLSWALCAGLPWLYRSESTRLLDVLALLAAPSALFVGVVLSRREHPSAPFLLLTAYPVGLSFGVSRVPHDQALSMFSPSTLVLMMLSLGAYAGTALNAADSRTRLRTVEHKPLGEVAQVAPSLRRRHAATLVLLTLTFGALAVLAFGSSATPARYREQWGQAASAGAVVAALAAGIVGCAMLAILTPGLRAERSETKPPPERSKRVGWLFLVAASGLVLYGLVR